MINSKTRSKLSAMAQKLSPIFQIGKNGITDRTIKELDDVLEARELIKIAVNKNSNFTPKEVINQLAKTLNAEPISSLGNKIVLYRKSSKENFRHILEI